MLDCPDFVALQPGAPPQHVIDAVRKMLEDATRRARIRCPACQWQPAPSNQWFCDAAGPPENFAPGCGMSWNTFSTRGVCPGCRHQWRWTACLQCNTWSPHEDWYSVEDDDDASHD